MEEFRNYDVLFPDLVYDIVKYFLVGNGPKKITEKSVLDYCQSSMFNKMGKIDGIIQPDTVHRICENLTKKGVLVCNRIGQKTGGWDASYIFLPVQHESFLKKDPALVHRLNCMAYGFRYIYSSYREFVFPIIVRKDEKVSAGTCFRFFNGIVTAKHCLEVDEVSIPGFSAEKLKQGTVFVSQNTDVDLAYIDLNTPSPLLSGKANVLDEVLVMGYPKIPMFLDFCAAECATISSIPTKGAIASLADQYLTRDVGQLMLITARIRGGNSGGPVIDSNGAIVGVAFSEPSSEGDYDEMGYGIAYPIQVLIQFLESPSKMVVNFVDAVQ